MAAEDDQTDAARAAMISKAIDVTAGFLPGAGDILGDTASHLAKASLDTLTSESIEGLKNSLAVAPDTDAYLDGAVDGLAKKLEYHALDTLIQYGYLQPGRSINYDLPPLPPEVLVGDPPHLDPRLVDGDGDDIDMTGMNDADRARAENMHGAWAAYLRENEPAFRSLVFKLVAADTFKTSFIDPTLG